MSTMNKGGICHWIVLSHGNNGETKDVEFLQSKIEEQAKDGVDVLHVQCLTCNSNNTHEGINVGGKRIAQEVKTFYMDYIENCHYDRIVFSVAGHSLGGLYLRFAIADIVQWFDEECVTGVEYKSYLSICTPHLGMNRTSKPGYFNWMEKAISVGANVYVRNWLGPTGQQLAVIDKDGENGQSLLLEMSDPNGKFIKALNRFSFRTIVGATHYDMSVPHSGACIQVNNPFTAPNYSPNVTFHIVGHSNFESSACAILSLEDKLKQEPEKNSNFSDDMVMDSECIQQLPSRMLVNLRNINWRRVHVQFEIPGLIHTKNGCVHDLVINKLKPFYLLKENPEGAIQCVNFLARLLLCDHGLVKPVDSTTE